MSEPEVAVTDEMKAALDEVIAARSVVSVYQPIVDIDSGHVVAYEALARGPKGSAVEYPDRLFATARAAGRLDELDWVCRAAAVRGAMEAGLRAPFTLFCNMEPEAIDAVPPDDIGEIWEAAKREVRVMTEMTERALTARPAELLSTAAGIRDAGWGIALDDVGTDAASLALMPFLDPDVIKLDMRLIQDSPTEELAEVINAVNAEAERSNLTILSEGIENDAHLRTSLAFGATLGQGWYFGKPGPLPDPLPTPGREVALLGRTLLSRLARPSRIIGTLRSVRRGSRALLASTSRHLETQALTLGKSAVVLGIFEDSSHFAGTARQRYEQLAASTAFVGVLGPGIDHAPADGVRGASLQNGDDMFGEWGMAIISPHFACAFVGRPVPHDGGDADHEYDFALTYNREFAVETARSVMSRITPQTAAPQLGAGPALAG